VSQQKKVKEKGAKRKGGREKTEDNNTISKVCRRDRQKKRERERKLKFDPH